MTPTRGDVLIRAYAGSSYQLPDVTVASERCGAVPRENVDNRGRPLGNAVLLPPKQEAPQAPLF